MLKVKAKVALVHDGTRYNPGDIFEMSETHYKEVFNGRNDLLTIVEPKEAAEAKDSKTQEKGKAK